MNTEIIDRCTPEGWAGQCEVQIGSIKTLKLAQASDLLEEPDCCNDDFEVTGEVAMKPDSGFKSYSFQLNKAIFSESKREEKEGDIFEQRIDFARHGIDADVIKEICRLNNAHTVAVVELYNGQTRFVGTRSNPLRTVTAGDSTGRQQGDMITADLGLYRKATCPACFVGSSAIIPTSAASQPYAFIRVARSSGCALADISITPLSLRSFGQTISATTPGAQVQVIYTFGDFQNPLFRVSIPTSSDPSVIGNWTWLSGLSTIGVFETTIVEHLAGTSTAVTLNLNAKELEQQYKGSDIEIHVQVVDSGVYSNVATGRIPFFRNTALVGTFTGQVMSGIYYSNENCGILLSANNQRYSTTVIDGAMAFIGVDAGTSSQHKLEVFTNPESLDVLTISTPSFNSLVGLGGNTNRLRSLSFSTSGSHDLGAFSLRTFPSLQSFSAASAQITSLEFKQNNNLQDIAVPGNLLTGTIDFSVLKNAGQLEFENNALTEVILGNSKPNLTILDLENNDLDSTELDNLVDELWNMRADVKTPASIDLRGNPGSLSADSIAKIDGTGAYTGQGLVTFYGWTVTY